MSRGAPLAWKIEPRNKFFLAIASVTHEFRPANTVTFLCDVDLTEVETVRRNAAGEKKPSYTAFVVKALALALSEFSYANRRVCRRPWIPFSVARLQTFLHSDVAVAVERSVAGAESVAFLDVLRDADRLDFWKSRQGFPSWRRATWATTNSGGSSAGSSPVSPIGCPRS